MLSRLAWKYPNKWSSYLDGDDYFARKMWDELLYAILHTINFYQCSPNASFMSSL